MESAIASEFYKFIVNFSDQAEVDFVGFDVVSVHMVQPPNPR